MDRDELLTIALTMEANPGAYALLLGSGLSTSAGIPTGWGIVRSLIGRMASVEHVEATDPEAWYQERFGEKPGYSGVLQRVGRSPADRMAILRSFFEPTPDELEAKLKIPTAAHQAIARLVELGVVRMLVTTNFDNLLERALAERNITPIVIASPDAVRGALPYAHVGPGGCVVLKLHGDYLDTRLRNTEDELAVYPAPLKQYLARILDDFGLLICGWSADWDTALREAILDSPNRRFAAFWLQRGYSDSSELGKRVISHLGAATVRIEGAEQFFPRLVEAIESVRESGRPDPRSVAMAVASVKRYLAESRHYIRLHDVLMDEASRVDGELASEQLRPPEHDDTQGYAARLRAYAAAMERLLSMLAVVAFHGQDSQAANIARVIQRVARSRAGSGLDTWLKLQPYPALLSAYVVGSLSLPAWQFQHLAAVLLTPLRDPYGGAERPLVLHIAPQGVLEKAYLPDLERRYTPESEFITGQVKPLLREYLSDAEFLDAFDAFEYFLSLVYWDEGRDHGAPTGPFIWRRLKQVPGLSARPVRDVENYLRAETTDPAGGPALRAGFFGGSRQRLAKALQGHSEWLHRIADQMF